MRLIYFSRDYTTHDHRFLASLADRQYETYFLQLQSSEEKREVRTIPAGIKRIEWSGGGKPFSLVNAPQFIMEFRRIIREVKPDLIHAGPIQSCAFLAALAGFHPLISMSWGYDLLMEAERSWLMRSITRYTLKRSDKLITDCRTVMDKAIELGMQAEKTVSFPWGIDLSRFSHGKNPPGGSDLFTLISTRSWEPMYGVDVLAKAFVKAAEKNESLRLTLLGSGSLAPILREIFEHADVLDRVSFPGQVSQIDLPAYYHNADLYISTSHVDGSSVSLMEALATGRAVLVADIPGNREWIEPGINGWLFRDGDDEDLADKILFAAEQRQKLDSMSSAARKLAEERADWDKNLTILLDTYEDALSGC